MYIQDAPIDTGNPIFKRHKCQHFVTVGEISRFEMSHFYECNGFITTVYD